MDKSGFLIDFSSPAQKLDLKPLIPVPPQTSLAPKEFIEPSADPFDVLEIDTDPFENVLKHTISKPTSEQKPEENLQFSPECEIVQNNDKSESSDGSKSSKVEKSEPGSSSFSISVLNKIPLEHIETSSENEIPKHKKVNTQNLSNISPVSNNPNGALKNISKSSAVLLESNSQSLILADFSTEESLKAVIAKRVNRCIQETLDGSLKTNKNGNNSEFKKPQNKRSASFVGLSTVSDKKECNKLNKSCTEFNLETEDRNASNDSSGFGLLSPNSTDVSTEANEDDQVFKEAHKLSRTFSKLADSFRQVKEPDSDDDDIMSCKPRWLYTDSSEDEGEKLLKDPALNFRRRSDSLTLSSPVPQPREMLDSPALLAYKTRRSITHLQVSHNNTQEENKMKRSISVGSHLKEVPVIPTLVSTVPVNLMKTDDQPIKLRKKNIGDIKRGPLRAVMPIQSMTKEPLPIVGKLSTKQDTSPEARIQKTEYAMGTPSKDNSQLNITPVACSTPNKAESFVSSGNISLLKPVAPTVANKRHSLEGSIGSHKSRGVMPEGGSKARSNSANSSSIPRVMLVKPQPLRGLPLAPKSSSNLTATRGASKPNARNVNVPQKKNASHVKSAINARVLSEVKTKSPRQSKIRAAVSTISNLVGGKKTAGRDKENRVPK